MKIIQSYYMMNGDDNKKNIENFNMSYLSYLSLKEQYGHVTMYCNDLAYDKVFKYIPYDDIVMIDPLQDFSGIDIHDYWFLSKFSALMRNDEPAVHIDNDVISFTDVISDFYKPENDDKNVILQQQETGSILDAYFDLLNGYGYLISSKFPISYKERKSVNTGVIGFKTKKLESIYMDVTLKHIEHFYSKHISDGRLSFVTEQMALSELILHNNSSFKPHYILGYNTYVNDANEKQYIHLWADFKKNTIINRLVENKLKHRYPEHYDNILKFKASNT